MIISVTRRDIRRGKPSHATACPVAIALRRGGFRPVSVDSHEFFCNGESQRLPYRAEEWILAFDETGTGEPFSFRVRKP